VKRDWGGPERVAGNGFGEQIERILVSLFLDTMSIKGQRILTPYDDLTYQIIGCAMAVHRKLGPGYREDTYQRDLQVYLAEKNGSTQKLLVNTGFGDCERRTPLAIPKTGNNLLVHPSAMG